MKDFSDRLKRDEKQEEIIDEIYCVKTKEWVSVGPNLKEILDKIYNEKERITFVILGFKPKKGIHSWRIANWLIDEILAEYSRFKA